MGHIIIMINSLVMTLPSQIRERLMATRLYMEAMLDGVEPQTPLASTYTDKEDIERPLRVIYW